MADHSDVPKSSDIPKNSDTPNDNDIPHDNEGHTKAAWTAVIIVMLGFLVGCIAFLIPSVPLFWVGVGIVVLGGVVGKVMAMMGLGQAHPQGMVPSETVEIERLRTRARTEKN